MKLTFQNYITESIQGGITPQSQPAVAFAHYTVDDRPFEIMFSYDPKTQGLHINSLMAAQDSKMPASFAELMQKFASDVCSRFGPVNPQNISYTPSSGPLRNRQDGSEVRDRLFQRYIKQIAQNMPPSCKNLQQNPIHQNVQPKMMQQGKYDSHPFRKAFKGSDQEFAQFFGL